VLRKLTLDSEKGKDGAQGVAQDAVGGNAGSTIERSVDINEVKSRRYLSNSQPQHSDAR
jgi:hypothetical protein